MTKNSNAKKSKNCHTEEKKSKKYFHSFDAKKNLYHLRFKIIVALLNTFQNKYKFCLINYKNTFDKWKKLKYKEISEMEIKNLIKMFSNDEINKIIDNIEQNNILNEIFNEKFKNFFNMNIKYKDLYTEPKLKSIKIKGKKIQKLCQSFKYSINEYYPVFTIYNNNNNNNNKIFSKKKIITKIYLFNKIDVSNIDEISNDYINLNDYKNFFSNKNYNKIFNHIFNENSTNDLTNVNCINHNKNDLYINIISDNNKDIKDINLDDNIINENFI